MADKNNMVAEISIKIYTYRKPYHSLVKCRFCERDAQYWSQVFGWNAKIYHCQAHRREARVMVLDEIMAEKSGIGDGDE